MCGAVRWGGARCCGVVCGARAQAQARTAGRGVTMKSCFVLSKVFSETGLWFDLRFQFKIRTFQWRSADDQRTYFFMISVLYNWPRRAAPRRAASQRTAPHRTAARRTAQHRTTQITICARACACDCARAPVRAPTIQTFQFNVFVQSAHNSMRMRLRARPRDAVRAVVFDQRATFCACACARAPVQALRRAHALAPPCVQRACACACASDRVPVPHRTAPQRTAPHRTAPQNTTPHRNAPNRTAPYSTEPHNRAPHRTAQQSTTPRLTPPHRTAHHRTTPPNRNPDNVSSTAPTHMFRRSFKLHGGNTS